MSGLPSVIPLSSLSALDGRDRGHGHAGAHARRSVSPHQYSVVVVATFIRGCRRSRSKPTSQAASRDSSLSGAASIISNPFPAGRQPDQDLFSARQDPDADLSEISNLAMADLRKLPPGTLPPVVLKFDASSLPVCLITLKGEGLNETQLRDLGSVQRSQPGRERSRRLGPAAIWRHGTGRSWSTSTR